MFSLTVCSYFELLGPTASSDEVVKILIATQPRCHRTQVGLRRRQKWYRARKPELRQQRAHQCLRRRFTRSTSPRRLFKPPLALNLSGVHPIGTWLCSSHSWTSITSLLPAVFIPSDVHFLVILESLVAITYELSPLACSHGSSISKLVHSIMMPSTSTLISRNPLVQFSKAIRAAPPEIIYSPALLASALLYALAGIPLSWDQASAAAVSSLEGFRDHFGIDSGSNADEIKLIVSLVYIGDAAGAALSLFINDRIGRRWAYRL